jgi:uncharacterized protein YjbJ (UPF0337 family)
MNWDRIEETGNNSKGQMKEQWGRFHDVSSMRSPVADQFLGSRKKYGLEG